jgi:hypothetical protein
MAGEAEKLKLSRRLGVHKYKIRIDMTISLNFG